MASQRPQSKFFDLAAERERRKPEKPKNGATKIEEGPPQQAYQCGVSHCGRQDWLILPDSRIACNNCQTASPAFWYIPTAEMQGCGEQPRIACLKRIRLHDINGYTCGYCSNISFHMLEDGTLTCFRCRRPTLFRFFFPQTA